jgi:putative hydrolase of the HAD superfamily
MFKAAFFDRDGTLTHGNEQKREWMRDTVSRWSGRAYELPYDKMIALFQEAGYDAVKDVETEKAFWKRYYACLLKGEGISESLDPRSIVLFDELWCENNPPVPYPETVEVLEHFSAHGYRMGVISDTSPSLELTLQKAGIAKYFTSFTASSLVGASKPSPIIFNAALHAQGVTAAESLYVDDYDVEADGAREQGFTSFLIDREDLTGRKWVIRSLKEMVDFAEREKDYDGHKQ